MALSLIKTNSLAADAVTSAKIADATIVAADMATTGTADATTFLRGDMAWTVVAGDIESVTAGTGLNGGGTSGAVTVNLDTTLPNDTVISTSGAITTTGAFTSIGIDDNADALAMTIGSNERIGIGTANEPTNNNTVTPKVNISGAGVEGSAQLTRHTSVGAGGAMLQLAATRGTDVNSYTILQDDDGIGTLAWFGSDGTDFAQAAQISVNVDGTPGSNDMPARMRFAVCPDGSQSPTDRMTILSGGDIGIGTTTPTKQLHITKSAAADLVALADGANISVDFNTGQNFTVTLAGNRTLDNPTNVTAGQTGSIFVTQDGTGSRTLSYDTSWEFPAGTAPTLTTTAAAVDRIDYIVKSATSIQAVASLAYA